MNVDASASEPGAAARPGVAAFDFDGTLVPGDSLAPFLIRLRGRQTFGRLLACSGPAMLAAYRTQGRDGAKAALLLRTVAGLPASHVRAEGQRYGLALTERTRPDMVTRLRWHQTQGHRSLLVSASLAVYLESFGRSLGFDEVIATRLEADRENRLTGRLLGANVRGPEKAARLRRAIGPSPVELWAYGDSAGDREMLAMADHPLLVRSPLRRPRR